jgi:hypothetical protein
MEVIPSLLRLLQIHPHLGPISNAGFYNRVVRLQDDLVREIRVTPFPLSGGVFFVPLMGMSFDPVQFVL